MKINRPFALRQNKPNQTQSNPISNRKEEEINGTFLEVRQTYIIGL